MLEWVDWSGHWDEATVVVAVILVVVLQVAGISIARSRRDKAMAAAVDTTLDEVAAALQMFGAVQIGARWRPKHGRMVVVALFRDGREFSVQGRIGTATRDIVAAILMARGAAAQSEAMTDDAVDYRVEDGGWWTVLGVDRKASYSQVRSAYRVLAKERHPDQGGADADMASLNAAMDEAKVALRGGAG